VNQVLLRGGTKALDPDMDDSKPSQGGAHPVAPATPAEATKPAPAQKPSEIGGPKGLDPTRYGDWERDGRCVDF
jgi:hypothetical protein